MTGFDILINLIQTAFYPMFFIILVKQKKKYWQLHILIYWICFFAFLTCINIFAVSQGLLFFVTVGMSYILLSYISYYSKEEKMIFCCIPDLIVGISSNLYVAVIRGIVFPGLSFDAMLESHGEVYVLFATLLQFILFLFSARHIRLLNFRLNFQQSLSAFTALNLCNCMTVCFENVLFDEEQYRFYLALGILIVSVLAVIIYYLLISVSHTNENIYRSKIQSELYQNQKSIAEQTLKTRNELYEIRHDLVHLVRILSKDNVEKTNEEIQRIIHEYESAADSLPVAVKSASKVIDTVTSIKQMDAIDNGIDFKILMNYTNPPAIPDDDMYLILSNLLDNAIKHIGVFGKIEFTVKDIGDHIGIRIANSIDHPVVDTDGNFLHQSFTLNHGLGINMVKRAVEKNNGTLSFFEEQGMLVAAVLLPNTNHISFD